MSVQQPTREACLETLRLLIRSLQRAGLKFDAGGRRTGPEDQLSYQTRLEALRMESADCTQCRLCSGRSHVVFGEGDNQAKLMVIGDAPDIESDTQGLPFAGESGQLLTRILEAINLQRSQIYLTNVVKCIAHKGEPEDDVIEACLPFLQQQIEIIQPEIICALGPLAARVLQGNGCPRVPPRGKIYQLGTILVMPTHHPELLLRRPELKKETWIDVQILQRELASGATRRQ